MKKDSRHQKMYWLKFCAEVHKAKNKNAMNKKRPGHGGYIFSGHPVKL